jgi:hypothetical protein
MEKILLILMVLSLVQCSNDPGQSESIGKQYMPRDAVSFEDGIEIEPPRTAEPAPPPELDLERNNKIIRSGSMNFEVAHLTRSKEIVDDLITKHKAYYENEQYTSYGDRVSYTLIIRVPSGSLESLLIGLETGVGKLISKNISSRDATEEYVDLNIRLGNNMAYLSQYKEILKGAKTVEEILNVQEKVRRIEEEIESKKGRIQFLDDKVNYSTLNLEISELVSSGLSNQPSFVRRMTNAFQNGIDGFLDFILVLANLWPFLILGLLLLTFRKKIVNRVKRK